MSEPESLDLIEEEFNDFLLSPNDIPQPDTYHVTKTIERPCAGSFWNKVGKMKRAAVWYLVLSHGWSLDHTLFKC